jgi:hypothetical protein
MNRLWYALITLLLGCMFQAWTIHNLTVALKEQREINIAQAQINNVFMEHLKGITADGLPFKEKRNRMDFGV